MVPVATEGTDRQVDIAGDYLARVLKDYDGGDRKLRVVWDPGNGSGCDITKALAGKLPGEHFVINGTVDGTFPNHHPDPTVPKNLEQLIEEVAKQKADLGIAFDGDADRIGVVDDEGHVLFGDQLMVVLSRDVLKSKPGGTIIADVKASQVLFDEIAKAGGQPLMWKTGHSLIKAKMKEVDSPLGGEMSGHIFFKERWFGFDDGTYAACRLLEILSRASDASAVLNALPTSHSTTGNHSESVPGQTRTSAGATTTGPLSAPRPTSSQPMTAASPATSGALRTAPACTARLKCAPRRRSYRWRT